MMSRFSILAKMSLAGASVALIILVDIATGQGPPALNGYLGRVPPPDFRQSGPLPPGLAYPPPPPFPPGEYVRGEYDSTKKGDYKEGDHKEKGIHKDLEFKHEKKDFEKNFDLSYEKDYEKYGSSTPAPGVMSSFSDAWKSFTSLGRHKRSYHGHHSSSKSSSNYPDETDWAQHSNQGYIFFKVPRNLVCYS